MKNKLNNIINLEFLILPMNLEQAGYISSQIKSMLVKKNIDKMLIRRIAVAIYEAEINVVIHSYGGLCNVLINDDQIIFVFNDTGPGIKNIEEAMQEGFSTAPEYAIQNGFGAGLGLSNIKKASDNFEIISNPNGTKLTIGFKL